MAATEDTAMRVTMRAAVKFDRATLSRSPLSRALVSSHTSHNAGILHLVPSSEGGTECSVLSQQGCTEYSVQLKC